MAIPLIIGVAAGAVGLYKGAKAISNNKEAKDIESSAQSIIESAQKDLEKTRENTNAAFTDLGEKKAVTLATNIKEFIDEFEKIKNIDLSAPIANNLTVNDFSHVVVDALEEQINFIQTTGLGIAGGATSGSLLAYGAYSGVMALGTASTGTAIGSLTGAAATNATLAWLGGGTLATGGGGIAAGTMALGALTAGPALAVAGWYMASKAEKNLENARSNLAEARRFRTDVETSVSLLTGMLNVAAEISNIFSELRKYSRRELTKLKDIFNTTGYDYQQYTPDERAIVMKNIKIAQVIKTLIDTPILDENGNLLGDVESNVTKVRQQIEGLKTS